MSVRPRGTPKPKVPKVQVPEEPVLSEPVAEPKTQLKRSQLNSSQLKQLAEWYELTGSYARTAKLAEEAGIKISATSISTKLRERKLYLDSI